MNSYMRDPDSGALINTDDSHYRAIVAARESQKREQRAQEQLDTMHNELREIKNILQSLGLKEDNGKTGS